MRGERTEGQIDRHSTYLFCQNEERSRGSASVILDRFVLNLTKKITLVAK